MSMLELQNPVIEAGEADIAESLSDCPECGAELPGDPPLDGAGNPSPRACEACPTLNS